MGLSVMQVLEGLNFAYLTSHFVPRQRDSLEPHSTVLWVRLRPPFLFIELAASLLSLEEETRFSRTKKSSEMVYVTAVSPALPPPPAH